MKLKIPMWLKVFGTLYIAAIIANVFAITQFIGETIQAVLAFWIAGYVLCKVLSNISTTPSAPISNRCEESWTEKSNRIEKERLHNEYLQKQHDINEAIAETYRIN